MKVKLKNPKTGQVKSVELGWSWILFLFGDFFGIPLFFRGLYIWGALVLVILFLDIIINRGTDAICVDTLCKSRVSPTGTIFNLIYLGLSIFFGVKGNEMTVRKYIAKDWQVVDLEEDEIVKNLKDKLEVASVNSPQSEEK